MLGREGRGVSQPSPHPQGAHEGCAKSEAPRDISCLGGELLFWQLEPSRNHWNGLFALLCCGEQSLGAGGLPMRAAEEQGVQVELGSWIWQGWDITENLLGVGVVLYHVA